MIYIVIILAIVIIDGIIKRFVRSRGSEISCGDRSVFKVNSKTTLAESKSALEESGTEISESKVALAGSETALSGSGTEISESKAALAGAKVRPLVLITHLENGGAIAGIGRKHRGFLLVAETIIIILLVLLAGLFTMPVKADYSGSSLYKIGLSMIIGGGISNLEDRLCRGTVTDYIRFPRFPLKKISSLVFNISDFCIFIGAAIYLYTQFRGR